MNCTSVVLSLLALVVISSLGCDATVYPQLQGWYQNRKTNYYDFGSRSSVSVQNTVNTSPLYVLIYGTNATGSPMKVPGQHNIAAFIPPDSGYSDLWNIVFLQVDGAYVANSVQDADVATTLFPVYNLTGPLVNCPVVPTGSMLGGVEDRPRYPITTGWHKNNTFVYFDFGPTAKFSNPEYTFPTISDQDDIVDTIQNQAGYSDFKLIYDVAPQFPSSYKPNHFKSFATVKGANLTPLTTGVTVNRPVVFTDSTTVPDDTSSGSTRILASIAWAALMIVFAM